MADPKLKFLTLLLVCFLIDCLKMLFWAYLTSVLIFGYVQSTLNNSNLQGKSKKVLVYWEFKLSGV